MYVLDASAVVALLYRETGGEVVWQLLEKSVISAVNASEVVARLVRDGETASDARAAMISLGVEVVPFDGELAFATGALVAQTRDKGLSLGDRACLALARRRKEMAVTADRNWGGVRAGVKVRLIR